MKLHTSVRNSFTCKGIGNIICVNDLEARVHEQFHGNDCSLDVVGCHSLPTTDPMWDCSPPAFAHPDPYPSLAFHTPCHEGEGHYFYTQKKEDNRLMSPPEGSGYPIGKKANYNYLVLMSHYLEGSETMGQVIDPVSVVIDILSENEIQRKAGMIAMINSSIPDPSRPNLQRNN